MEKVDMANLLEYMKDIHEGNSHYWIVNNFKEITEKINEIIEHINEEE